MEISRVFVLGLIVALSNPALALDVQGLNDKVGELELDQEVEEMDSFGEAARVEQTKQESKDISEETRRLQREIGQMERESAKNRKKADQLTIRYNEKETLARKTQNHAMRAEKERDNTRAKVAKLEARIAAKEELAINAISKRKSAEQENKRLLTVIKNLNQREKVAIQTIKRNEAKKQLALKRGRELLKRQATTNARVRKLERQASK